MTDRDGTGGEDFPKARERMVDGLKHRIDRPSTERALRAVPRHKFVPSHRRDRAYVDRPLPIGKKQTISAPHMVAIMVDQLALESGESVLEIGTGCGYHAAVTAEVVGAENVYSVEYFADLANRARKTLDSLGYEAISIRIGDGNEGWPAHAPFDAAYLTCAAPSFPDAVTHQVRDGGRLLAPIGRDSQQLVFGRKRGGELDRDTYGPVRFVQMREE